MAKILVVGSHLDYNLEHYTVMALRSLGHEVTFLGYREIAPPMFSTTRIAMTRSPLIRRMLSPVFLSRFNGVLKRTVALMEPSLVLSIKGEAVLPLTVDWMKDELGVKVALWYPDDPSFFKSLTKIIAPHYDIVFTASERAVPRYGAIGVKKVKFLPLACEPTVHKKATLSKKEMVKYGHDVCFVGAYYPRRGRVISKLKGFNLGVYGPYWRLFYRWNCVHDPVRGSELAKVFNASKITLDVYDEEILRYEVSMRAFEATGCGAFLLTEKAYGIERLFKIGEEIQCYSNLKELTELIKYYLDNEEEREDRAIKGQSRAYSEHTYLKRVKCILNEISLRS